MKKSSFRRLSPEEFDVDLLRQLTLEGRVYISVPQNVDKDAYKHEILEYVSGINEFVAEEWKEDIDGVWRDIVDAACMSDSLVMKKGMLAGHMSHYAVTNIVCRMQQAGLYRKEVPMLTLHLCLENTTQKNKYYKGYANYSFPREARIFLKQLFLKV